MKFKSIPKFLLIKSLAFLCAFILLTVAVLGSHGSALSSDDFSFSDRTENIGGDIKSLEEKDSNCERREYENGNSTINNMVDVKDSNVDYADFDYPNVLDGTVNDAPWDYDNDNLPDGYETFYGLNPSVGIGVNGTGDFDNDGLSNPDEYMYGITSDYNVLSKSFNGKILCYLPKGVYWNGTNPSNPDTDYDGLKDGEEVNGFTALNYDGTSTGLIYTDPLDPDWDNDNVTDGMEKNGWSVPIMYEGLDEPITKKLFTNPIVDEREFMDVDEDGLSDLVEINMLVGLEDSGLSNDEKDNIRGQYNPFVKENLPPKISNVKVSPDVKTHWEFPKIGEVFGVAVYSPIPVFIVDHCWAKVEFDIEDITTIKELKVKCVDTGDTETMTNIVSGHYSFGVDIDYWRDYIGTSLGVGKYQVTISATDSNGNSVSASQLIAGKFSGAVQAFVDNFVERLNQALNIFSILKNKIHNWVVNQLDGMLKPILQGIAGIKSTEVGDLLEDKTFMDIIMGIDNGSISAEDIIVIIQHASQAFIDLLTSSAFALYAAELIPVMMFALLFVALGVISMDDINVAFRDAGIIVNAALDALFWAGVMAICLGGLNYWIATIAGPAAIIYVIIGTAAIISGCILIYFSIQVQLKGGY